MSSLSKLTISIIVVGLAVFALAGQFVQVRETATSTIGYTTNAGELVGDALVGQTFVAEHNNLSGVGVLMATYSNRQNTGEVELHVRPFPDTSGDIRTASVAVSDLKDNQVRRFLFEPIPDSQGQTYLFYLTGSGSTPGRAVTVDLDTRDPYHRGSAYIVRGRGAESTTPAVLATSGKPTVDVAFETYQTVLLRDALVHKTVATGYYIVGSWPERREEYLLLGQVMLQTLAVVVAVVLVWRPVHDFLTRQRSEQQIAWWWLTLFFIAGLALRVLYAQQLPVTYDEGNYLYDARTWLEGNLAGGDGYVKSPAVIAWVSLWQLLLGHTILAGRLSSVLVGALTMFPVYFLARETFAALSGNMAHNRVGRRMGLVAAALWACAGTAVVGGIYVHTQPLAIFLSVSGLAVLAMALRGTTPRLTFITQPRAPSVQRWFVLAGMLLGLGVTSRKSILALGLVPLLLIFLLGKSWKLRAKHVIAVGIGFVLVTALFLGLAWWMYGSVGVQEAIGINSAEDGISAVDPAEAEQVRAYSLRGMTPFFRESLPIILLLCLGLGVTGEQWVRSFFRVDKDKPSPGIAFLADHLLPKLGWVLPLVVFWWAWGFFSEYEGQAFLFWGIPWMWYVFGLILLVAVLLPRLREEQIEWRERASTMPHSHQPSFTATAEQAVSLDAKRIPARPGDYTVSFWVPLLWVGGLVFFYMNWIKFHANYITEFIPPLVIMAGAGAVVLFDRVRLPLFFAKDYPVIDLLHRVMMALLLLLLGWALFVSNYITFMYAHTGSYDQATLKQTAAWARQYISLDEPIFTGAAVIPYLSGHHTALDIAHPRWYAYEFTRTNVQRFETFLPPVKDMEAAFQNAQWFLLDEQTRFSFFQEYDHIKKEVNEDFKEIKDFDGLTFYQRVR